MPVRCSFYRRIIGAVSVVWPSRQPISLREKCRASVGATLGTWMVALLAAAWVGGLLAHQHSLLSLALVAPLGASAVLVFAVPSSPLAQPWSVVGGNTLSALVGIACFKCIPDASLAAGLAVGLAMGVMFAFRCLHPPGGASALLMVLMGCDRFSFAMSPVLLDSMLLVGSGLLYNNLTGRSWPHVPRLAATSEATRLHRADLDAVLARHHELLDISTDDLHTLLEQVESMTYQRTLGHVRCADVMTATPLTARVDMTLAEAWAVVRKHRIKALPVVDSRQYVLGIVTVADFMRQLDLEVHEGLGQRLRALVRAQPVQARQVGQIMTRTVRVASYDRLLIDLVPVFSENGHRHIPIIDKSQRLVGIITQTDLVRALYTAVRA